ncbi:alpha/beta fold hydrolase [Aliikangiella sp. IMCC44632]
MKIVLLPGLDGSGNLFTDLLKALPLTFNVDVVSYSSLVSLSYSDQAKEIAARYKQENIFLVGESYSGRVAYEICQIQGNRVKGLVFIASFVSRPSIYSHLASIIPVSFLRPNYISKLILYIVGFNMSGRIKRVDSVFKSLEQTDKTKLKERFKNIASMDKPTKKVACPVTYISPSKDFLVSKRSLKYLASLCTNFSKVEVLGGHFIAQSNPIACAKAIANAVNISRGY